MGDVVAPVVQVVKKIRSRSTVAGAVAKVWQIASSMVGSPRSAVLAACVAAGINLNTAKTQYYRWTKSLVQQPA